MAKWTEKRIENVIEKNGGDTLCLLDVFPFTDERKEKIDIAFNDEENYTDSDLCDYVLELALEQINN